MNRIALLLAMILCAAGRVCAQENPFLAKPEPRTDYTRTEFRSVYNYQAFHEASEEIRRKGEVTPERPLLASKVGQAVRLSASLRAECVKVADDEDNPDALRCLANTALWLATADDQRLSAAIKLHNAVVADNPLWRDHAYYYGPLLTEWLGSELDESDRETALTLWKANSNQGVTKVRDFNGMPGCKLFGLELQDEAAAQYWIHNGAVFGDPKNFDPGADGAHRQTVAYSSLLHPEGPGVEGLAYTGYHGPFLFWAICHRELTGEDWFRLSYFRTWPLWFSYLRGNNDEWLDFETERYKRSYLIGGQNFFPIIALYEIGLTSNPQMAGLCRFWLAGREKNLGGSNLPVWLLYEALRDPDLAPVSPSTLPLTRVFTGHTISSRTSWEGSDATCVVIKAPVFTTRYSGSRGAFQVWHNGAMVVGKHLQVHDYDGGGRENNVLIYREDWPGIEWAPAGCMDRAQFFLSSAQFGPDGPSIAELESLPVRDPLESVTDSETELRVVLSGENVYVPTWADPNAPQSVAYPSGAVRLARKHARTIIWRKQKGIIVVHDRIELRQGERAELRWNTQGKPAQDGSHWIATSDYTTEFNEAHAKISFDFLQGSRPRIIGGTRDRNADLFGALRTANRPRSISTLPENDWQNLILGMWRIQVPVADGEWLTVIQLLDSEQPPSAVDRGVVVVGSEAINYVNGE